MASTTYKQELPPPKGYEKIVYERIPLKKPWPASLKWGLYFGVTLYGIIRFRAAKQLIQDESLEERASRNCLMPIFLAEKDRARLRDYKKARDDEIELMKDVPGWVPGTLWGEPVYQSVGPNDFYTPLLDETYVHASTWDWVRSFYYKKFW